MNEQASVSGVWVSNETILNIVAECRQQVESQSRLCGTHGIENGNPTHTTVHSISTNMYKILHFECIPFT